MHVTMHVVHKSEKQHATMHVVHKYEKQPATMHVVHKFEKQHATMQQCTCINLKNNTFTIDTKIFLNFFSITNP